MKPGVVLVSHGSREAGGNEAFLRLAADVRARKPEWQVGAAFVDNARPPLLEVLHDVVAAGCSPTAIVPCQLFPGGRMDEDISHAVDEVSGRRPGSVIRVARPLGEHEATPDILLDSVPMEMLTTPRSLIVLVAAGSIALANRDAVEKLAGTLRMRGGLSVRWGYLDRGEPLVAGLMPEALAGKPPFIAVLPCLLFPGLFMRDLERSVAGWRSENLGIRFYLGKPLAEDPRISAIVEAVAAGMLK